MNEDAYLDSYMEDQLSGFGGLDDYVGYYDQADFDDLDDRLDSNVELGYN